jgi:hypothetical protein
MGTLFGDLAVLVIGLCAVGVMLWILWNLFEPGKHYHPHHR